MVNEDKLVHVGRVAKNVLAIGRFGLFQINFLNIIATDQFMLNVTEEQFWKIQCKLEARQTNIWLFRGKEGLQECNGVSDQEIYDMYTTLIKEPKQKLHKTWLIFGQIELYTDANKYIGIPVHNLTMLDYSPTLEAAPGRESVIVDNVHIFTMVERKNTECKFLKPLSEIERGE